MATSPSLYDQDFYAWSNQQAALLRAGKLSQADIENIAEEIESMGKSEKKELVSRLRVLMLHLMKWQFQPEGRGSSWQRTIKVQRVDLQAHMLQNPSLEAQLPVSIASAYEGAVIEAADETGLPEERFPSLCPYSYDQMMDPGFWPD